jgi:hypothetical protein
MSALPPPPIFFEKPTTSITVIPQGLIKLNSDILTFGFSHLILLELPISLLLLFLEIFIL